MQQAFLRIPKNERGRDFAVGDIHGHFSRLQESLDAIGFDPGCDRLFSVGDLIDRGPESEASLRWLDKPWFHAVQGNHEDYAMRHVRTRQVDMENWAKRGGAWFLSLSSHRQRAYAAAYTALPVAIEIVTRTGLVGVLHADCPVRDWSSLEGILTTRYKRSRAIAQWSRARLERANCAGVAGVRAVVVGHTPVTVPRALGNVIHIDTAGWEPTGYFTLLDLDSLQAWPQPIEEQHSDSANV